MSLHEQIATALADAVAGVTARIIACQGCGTEFFKVGKRTACTPRCGAALRQRRFRQRHGLDA